MDIEQCLLAREEHKLSQLLEYMKETLQNESKKLVLGHNAYM
jgi:hypothetical protein